MKRVVAALVVLTAVFGFAVTSSVQGQPGPVRPAVRATEQPGEQVQSVEKLALAQRIVQLREDLQQRGPLAPAFKQYWTDRLVSLSLDQLASVAQQGSSTGLEAAIASATGTAYIADTGITSLGDSSADLVYTKVAPCRVADTRVAGGILGTGATRSFYVAGLNLGDFPSQGGTACGIPLGPATAVAMNITVVGASGYGWLRAYPYGGSGNASIINYNAGDTIANGLVMPICDIASSGCARDLTVVADSYGGHVLIDVMGYWAKVTKAQYRSFTALTAGDTATAIPLSGGCVNYLSQTVQAPVAGRITVTANAQFMVHHTQGTPDGIFFGIATTATNCTYTWGWLFAINSSAVPSDDYYPMGTVSKTYDVAAGSYTYYLNAYRNNNPSGSHFFYAELLTRFEPQ